MLEGLTCFLIFQLGGEVLVKAIGLPVPGPVAGLILLALSVRLWPRLRTRIGDSADSLLAHLSLLFVPAGVGVVLYFRELLAQGWALLAVLLISTWAGLAVTALVAQALTKDASKQMGAADDV